MINPNRLELARRRRGWTKTKLAQRVDVSTKSITNYESGDQQPTDATLARIADELGFPESFFAEPDVEVIAEAAASFRSLASMTASQRHQALGAGTLAMLIDEWIEQHFARPAPTIPIVDTHDLGVRVFSLDEQGRDVDAFSFWRNARPYVLLNTTKSAEHSRFDAAHELRHIVLHRTGELGREAEHQANQFASGFLMPRAGVLAAGLQHATLTTLIQRSVEEGLPHERAQKRPA